MAVILAPRVPPVDISAAEAVADSPWSADRVILNLIHIDRAGRHKASFSSSWPTSLPSVWRSRSETERAELVGGW